MCSEASESVIRVASLTLVPMGYYFITDTHRRFQELVRKIQLEYPHMTEAQIDSNVTHLADMFEMDRATVIEWLWEGREQFSADDDML